MIAFVTTATFPESEIMTACRYLVGIAQREGRVPVALMWGGDVRAAWSAWLDSDEAKAVMIEDPNLEAFPDHRICDYAGLPAFPMVADGVALRTVAMQKDTGFD